ncbi:MAG: hypothetical protein CSA34_05655 [Desulfobulbus propionicus]|nr:MAG: hypothetical protein CSA34_05655 [Desulfobulbus propionicus]
MFETKNVTISESADARKTKIEKDQAWDLFTGVQEVVIGRGKNFTVFTPNQENQEDILKQALGRSGTLRAPTLRIGDRVIVGYSEPMYKKYI